MGSFGNSLSDQDLQAGERLQGPDPLHMDEVGGVLCLLGPHLGPGCRSGLVYGDWGGYVHVGEFLPDSLLKVEFQLEIVVGGNLIYSPLIVFQK